MSSNDILIIGAGPFGLSISAHLRALRVDHRIVGKPIDTWRAHMPAGMYLKSEPYASDVAAPKPGFDVEAYCRSHGRDYVKRLGPLPLGLFIDYADWYVQHLAPDAADLRVTGIEQLGSGFRVQFADADPVTCSQVVVATGLLPYATMPPELTGLPADLVSHASDHAQLGRFRGRRVAVIGSGQSALETAALLHESGADVQIIARAPQLSWLDPAAATLTMAGQVRRPPTKLCEGWRCVVWNTPALWRRLPEDLRIEKARTVLGPVGSWWLKDRVEGVIDALTGHRIYQAAVTGSRMRLTLDGATRSTIEVDHVIAGTGFRVDIARLPFLSDGLRAQLRTPSGYPVLSRRSESAVPGLYFAGAHAAASLGPAMRFLGGTHSTARLIARSVASGAAKKGSTAGSARDQQASVPVDAAVLDKA